MRAIIVSPTLEITPLRATPSPGGPPGVPATLNGKGRVLVFAAGENDPPTGGLLGINPADGRVAFTFPSRGTR